jgi:hypothetical protein
VHSATFASPKVGDRVGAFNCFDQWREGTVTEKKDHWLLVDIGEKLPFLTTVNEAVLLPAMSKYEKSVGTNDPRQ